MYVNYIPIVTCVTLRQATSAILVSSLPPLSASSSPSPGQAGAACTQGPKFACSHHLYLSPPTRDVGRFFVINHPMQLATSPLWRFWMWGRCFDCGVDISTVGWTMIMGWMFWMRADVLTMGWTFRLWVDDLATGQTLRLWGGCFNWHWDGHFDYGAGALTVGRALRLWDGCFDCGVYMDIGVDISTAGVCISAGHRHMLGIALFCSVDESSL